MLETRYWAQLQVTPRRPFQKLTPRPNLIAKSAPYQILAARLLNITGSPVFLLERLVVYARLNIETFLDPCHVITEITQFFVTIIISNKYLIDHPLEGLFRDSETNNTNENNRDWREADQLVIYKDDREIDPGAYPEQSPASARAGFEPAGSPQS